MTIKGIYFTANKRPGKPIRHYVYAWRGGPLIMTKVGGTRPTLDAEAMERYHVAAAAHRKPDPRTTRSLIIEWRTSRAWADLSAGTRKTWGSQINRIEERWGDAPLSIWNDPRMTAKVVKWRDERAANPRGADLGVTVLRHMLRYGRLNARVLMNVAEKIPTLYRGGNRSEIVWTDEDIDRFCWQALKDDLPQLIDGIWLAALTGLRRADLVTVSAANVYDHAIVKKALKVSRNKRRTATMPRIPELDALLGELNGRDRAEGVTTLLVNSFGKPWSGDGFGGSFGRVRKAAEIFHVDPETKQKRAKHLHDLRGTFCTRLILAGLTDEEAADVMGWSREQVSDIRRVYVDQSRVVVAIGERIAARTVNHSVNQSGGDDEKRR